MYDANGINIGNFWLLMETRYDGNQPGVSAFHFVCPRHSLTATSESAHNAFNHKALSDSLKSGPAVRITICC